MFRNQPSASSRQNTGSLPDKFMCKVGNEWKDARHFSKKQHELWFLKAARRQPGLTPANAGLVCRVHSGEPLGELKCRGPCGKYKSVDEFSGSARKHGGRQWCIKCVQWTEFYQSGKEVIAAPSHERTAGEAEVYEEKVRIGQALHALDWPEDGVKEGDRNVSRRPSSNGDDDKNLEGHGPDDHPLSSRRDLSSCGAPSERGTSYTGGPIKSASHFLTTIFDETSGTSGTYYDIAAGGHEDTAYHRSDKGKARDKTTSLAPSSVPPHMSGNGESRGHDRSYMTSSAPTRIDAMSSTGTALPAAPAPRRQNVQSLQFTAYGPNGEAVKRTKEKTMISESVVIAAASNEKPDGRKGWAKPTARKIDIPEPDYLIKEDPKMVCAHYDDDDSSDGC